MDDPKDIWDDIEELRERIRIKRRQITGGDIEDDITLKGKSVVYLLDGSFDQFEERLGKIYDNIMDGVYDLGLGAHGNIEDLAGEIKGLREHIDNKKKKVADKEDEFEEFDLIEEIHEKWESILKRFKDRS